MKSPFNRLEDSMRTARQPPTLLPFLGPMLLCLLYSLLSSNGMFGPFKRGFYADDEDISYPMRGDTVPYSIVVVIAVVITPLCIVIGNYGENKKRIGSQVFIYYFGLVLSMTLTAIAKGYAGQLRPDFIARCKPDYDLALNAEGFITEDICTGDEGEVSQGRKSHPSGHSSTAAFSGVYILTVWLRAMERYHIHPAISTVAMAVIVMYPVYVATSRVSDYKHHPVDVVVGCLLGSMCALYTAYFLNGWVGGRRRRPCKFSSSSIAACPSAGGEDTGSSDKCNADEEVATPGGELKPRLRNT